jgi:hypothetical protein
VTPGGVWWEYSRDRLDSTLLTGFWLGTLGAEGLGVFEGGGRFFIFISSPLSRPPFSKTAAGGLLFVGAFVATSSFTWREYHKQNNLNCQGSNTLDYHWAGSDFVRFQPCPAKLSLCYGLTQGQAIAWFVCSHIPKQLWTDCTDVGEFIAACKRALELLEVPKSRRAAIDLIGRVVSLRSAPQQTVHPHPLRPVLRGGQIIGEAASRVGQEPLLRPEQVRVLQLHSFDPSPTSPSRLFEIINVRLVDRPARGLLKAHVSRALGPGPWPVKPGDCTPRFVNMIFFLSGPAASS